MMLGEVVLAWQQAAWFGLVTLGLLFLFIAFRLRDERAFSLLGVGILLLCAFVGVDLWTQFPGLLGRTGSRSALEAWLDLGQILASAYVLTTLWFTRSLTGRPGRSALRLHGIGLGILSIGFVIDAVLPAELFVAIRNWAWHTSWAYDWIFTPYLIGLFAWVILLTVRGLKEARGKERRTLRLLVITYAILFGCGLMDFLAMWIPGMIPNTSATGFGVLAMGMMGTFIFTDRLAGLYEDRTRSLLKIAEIRGAMETQGPLGDLGRSAARISEEIRGYVAGLKGDARSLRDDPAAGYRAEVARIEGARRKLEAYTTGILDFSKSSRLGEMRTVDLAALAERCRRERFSDFSARAHIRVAGRVPLIPADPDKLERALSELVRNSLEAGACRIEIRLREGADIVSLAVDDDGEGIGPEHRERISQPFFTTRKDVGASGLGASIAMGIAKAHGGSLRFYPKAGPRSRGLLANLILPKTREPGPDGEAVAGSLGKEIALVSDDGSRIMEFFAICANVGARPVVLPPGAAPRLRKPNYAFRHVILDMGHARERDRFPHAACYRLEAGNTLAGPGLRAGTTPPEREDLLVFSEDAFLAILSG